jgi:hypothetical protein
MQILPPLDTGTANRLGHRTAAFRLRLRRVFEPGRSRNALPEVETANLVRLTADVAHRMAANVAS